MLTLLLELLLAFRIRRMKRCTHITKTDIGSGRPRGRRLKVHHITAIAWLARNFGAEVEGLKIGSRTLLLTPGATKMDLRDRVVIKERTLEV